MGSYGRRIDGEEVIEKIRNGDSPWRKDLRAKLNDCPKCGAKQEDGRIACSYFGFRLNADGWAAYCRECKTSTVFCPTYEAAVNKWNEGDVK